MNITTCRACGAPIGFIKTVAGKTIPVDAVEVVYRQTPQGSQKIVTPNGEVVSGEITEDSTHATGIGYISHFATCPQADFFRKKRKSDRKKG